MTCYFPASLFVDSESWKRVPPTGVEMSRQLARYFSEEEYLKALTDISGRRVGSVRWLLSQEAVVPAGVLTAALKLRQRSPVGAIHHRACAVAEPT